MSQAVAAVHAINRKVFFDAVRQDPFKGSLTPDQVAGTEAILDEWFRRELEDLRWLAYMLATAFHETARTMQPIKEHGGHNYFMRMYDKTGSRPKVAANLGNTQVGDGALYCGRGYVQLTGRANYNRASKELNVDFVGAPDRVMEPRLAAAIMFHGMVKGWFTGKRLSDCISGDRCDFKNARRIINGLDKASTIAGYAEAFHLALNAAAVVEPSPVAPQSDAPPEMGAAPQPSPHPSRPPVAAPQAEGEQEPALAQPEVVEAEMPDRPLDDHDETDPVAATPEPKKAPKRAIAAGGTIVVATAGAAEAFDAWELAIDVVVFAGIAAGSIWAGLILFRKWRGQ